ATALLGGALAIPDGVPSQAGLLASHVPWRGQPPLAAKPHLLDTVHLDEPWLLFLRRELRAGRLPFWDPHQLAGEPFWSNGSDAPRVPPHPLLLWGAALLGVPAPPLRL